MTSSELFGLLQAGGIVPGDVLLVHSSLKAIGKPDANEVIGVFAQAIMPGGTLAVPTHTWATVNNQQPVFHQAYSPSTVGTLTNVLRCRPDAVRSLHPTHSVAAIGARAAELCADHELDETPCSPRSPYGKLIAWGGKVVLLGVDLRRCTFFHCLEEVAGLHEIWSVDKNRHKRYLIRSDGSVLETWARPHAHGVSENYHRVEGELLAAGAMDLQASGEAQLRVLDAAKAADYLVPKLRENPKFFW